jgi:hypothetical protein
MDNIQNYDSYMNGSDSAKLVDQSSIPFKGSNVSSVVPWISGLSIRLVLPIPFMGLTWPEREPGYSPPSNAKVNNV